MKDKLLVLYFILHPLSLILPKCHPLVLFLLDLNRPGYRENCLLDETGKPLIQHTWESARGCDSLDELFIATDSEEIAATVSWFWWKGGYDG